jgi:valyl-tRNA synthetase
MEQYHFHLAAEKLYHYVWHSLADVHIEARKSILIGPDSPEKRSAQYTLTYILMTSLKMLHPFMPFITETIWKHIPANSGSMLMVEKWPQ